jgi:hypothetical protein
MAKLSLHPPSCYSDAVAFLLVMEYPEAPEEEFARESSNLRLPTPSWHLVNSASLQYKRMTCIT